jgi:riboflavin synthase
MFTGLIQDVGTVTSVGTGAMTDLWIQSDLAPPWVRGESIAVNGCCLTLVASKASAFQVQASPVSLRRTTLGALRPGDRVNLERALRLDERLGGHVVQGHVDGVTALLDRRAEGGSLVMRFELPAGLARFFVEKGSVTLNGVSLTVNALGERDFSVALIPETRARTTLEQLEPGDRVNVEADLFGKYVARLFDLRGAPSPGLTAESVAAKGFGGAP